MLSSGMKCYHLELMLSSGRKCYHLGRNVIIWDEMLSSGANVFFNNGEPKILFKEAPLGNNSDFFNEQKKKDNDHNTTEVPLKRFQITMRTQFMLAFKFRPHGL